MMTLALSIRELERYMLSDETTSLSRQLSAPDDDWGNYARNRSAEQMVLDASLVPDPEVAYQKLLLHAIATADKSLEKILADRGISFLRDFEPYNRPWGGVLFQAIGCFGDSPDLIDWALRHGARIDARGFNDWTPLHMACQKGYIGVIRTLIEHGAGVNEKTRIDDHFTPLCVAIAAGHKVVVEFLLAHGADVGGAVYLASRERPEFIPILEKQIKKQTGLSRRKQKRRHGR
jgi:hypothetical protein